MSTTTHYGLYVTDDDTEKFVNWRRKVNAPTDSNMTKIDAALWAKAERCKQVGVVLTAADWSASAPYTQTISIADMTADDKGIISPSTDSTADQLEMAAASCLFVSGQSDGNLTITAYGQRPTLDIPAIVTIVY